MKRDGILACFVWALLSALATVLTGCGGGGGGGAGGDPGSTTFFPLAVGNHWAFGNNESVRVTGQRTVNGEPAFVVQSFEGSGPFVYETLYAVDSQGVFELPEATDPVSAAIGPILRMRFPVNVGDTFVQINNVTADLGDDYDGDGRTESVSYFSQVAVLGFETVSTPAGSFSGALHQRTELTETTIYSSDGHRRSVTFVFDEWFAQGVGPVRRTTTFVNTDQSGWSSDSSLVAYAVGGRRSESTPPEVVSMSPTAGSMGGPDLVLSVDFSEPMDRHTLTTSTFAVFDAAGQLVSGTVQLDSHRATFVPTLGWTTGNYTARVTTGATDLAGNPLATDREWSFSLDSTAPAVTAVNPSDSSVDVSVDSVITFTFSEQVDPASVTNDSVQIGGYWQDNVYGKGVAARVEVNGNTVIARPIEPLPVAATIKVGIQGVRDIRGNMMPLMHEVAFRTVAGRFAYPVTLPTGSSRVISVAIGDVNADGRSDVLLLTGFNFDPDNDYHLFVFLQQPEGALAAPVKYKTGVGYGMSGLPMWVTDLDGDGRNEVVIGEGENGVEVLQQNTQGSLVSAFRLDGRASDLSIIDVDGDGRKDVISFGGDGNLRVWAQSPFGVFGSADTYATGALRSLDVGDINGDDRPDIVIGGRSVATLLQQPDGRFGDLVWLTGDLGPNGAAVAVGDVNGDGRQDIVFGWGDVSPDSNVGVILQSAGGVLGAIQTMSTLDYPESIVIADVDSDGRNDIVVTHENQASVSLYRQKSDGTLMSEERFHSVGAGWGRNALAVGDINGDGRPDILHGSQVLLQHPPAATPSALPLRRPLSALKTIRRAVVPAQLRSAH